MFDPILLIISVAFIGIGMLVSNRLKHKFSKYSQEPLSSGLSGKDIAQKMLHDNGIYDVNVVSVEGQLSDHYNPENKTVNLSPDVYHGRHVASAAVAAHECGHAVQHATAYQWLTMRSKLVPAVQISSTLMNFLTFGLALIALSIPSLTNGMLLLFIVLQSIITLFSIITLPVEVDASQRALVWLDKSGITRGQENADAKDALKWAAYTYFISALGSIATLAYYIWRFMGNRRD
ncbi:MAG: zinc metallopeptidase [Bacteroidota bacterium]|jgi:Zn-dependent membrane protease YugP|nr:zinc metallopeptidase [Bacteroidota bacterium]